MEKPQEPLLITVRLSRNLQQLEELYRLIRQNPGSRQMKLCITSKLQNVVLDSAIRVDSRIILEIEKMSDVNVA
jgi:DNA polymerase-3 subunit alpha